MNLNDQGLPLPGRELDEWIAEHIFGRDPLKARHGLHENGDLEYYWGYPQGHDIAPHYSTTHAFFQVMEAKRDEWHFVIEMLDDSVVVWLYDAKEPLGTADLAMSEVDTYNKTIVNAVAHAVCSCAWKARQHG